MLTVAVVVVTVVAVFLAGVVVGRHNAKTVSNVVAAAQGVAAAAQDAVKVVKQ